jgi:transposase InsO family protein
MITCIKQIAIESRHTYGKRRINIMLNKQGFKVGIYKTASLMKKAGVAAIRPRKKHRYCDSEASYKYSNNILQRSFIQTAVNTHWVGDITYIKTSQGFSYLASVLDLSSKQIVGWSLSKNPNAELSKNALSNAIARHNPDTTKLMFHSDQGVQYSAKKFTNYCDKLSITTSMSRRGNCWDNAVMERFFRSLKTEKINYEDFNNHFEVVKSVESYIYFYNYKRIHSAIGYKTPVEKMAELMKVA